jgi:hypothetical protein
MPTPRTRQPSSSTGTDTALVIVLGLWVTALAFDAITWLTGNLTNTWYGTGPWTHFATPDAALHPHQTWPRLGGTALLVGARIIPALLTLTLALATTCTLVWLRLRAGAGTGLARKTDLAPLLGKQITTKARDLRPSLADREGKRGRLS